MLRALTPLTSDIQGDYWLRVTGSVNAGGGGTSMADNSAFTPGTSSVTPIGAYYGPRSIASGRIAAPALNASAVLQVDIISGAAGGGVANLTMRGTANTDVYVGVASGPAGAWGNWNLPVVYASGFYPTVNIGAGVVTVNLGSIPTVNLGLGTVNLGNVPGIVGSVGVTPLATFTVALDKVATVNLGLGTVNIGNGIVGSVGVTPLATFTVSLDKVATVNLGLGTVNIGNGIVGSVGVTPLATFTVAIDKIATVNLGLGTVNIGNIVKVDVSASLTATTWPIGWGGSGHSAIVVASSNPAVRAYISGITIIATGTIDFSIQSPINTFLTGSLRILPGAGFVRQGGIKNPILIGDSNATVYVHATGTQNVGGWFTGWVE